MKTLLEIILILSVTLITAYAIKRHQFNKRIDYMMSVPVDSVERFKCDSVEIK